MKFLLILLFTIVTVYSEYAQDDDEYLLALNFEPIIDAKLNFQWRQYKVQFKKVYKTTNEENLRRSIWERNLKMINEHNKAAKAGKIKYKLGLNEFSDWTKKETKKLFGTISIAPGIVSVKQHRAYRNVLATDLGLPSSIDWRELGYVTRVRNQGLCGSCWAFAVVATLEAQEFNATGTLVELSEQNLVDCTRTENKCDPFWVTKAFEYIIRNDGIDSHSSYPYVAVGGSCQFSEANIAARMTDFREVSPVSEDQLLHLLATVGPIAVSINSQCVNFVSYKSGIFDGSGCRSDTTNHAVTIVGYVSNEKDDYYIIKNSWGTTWGENGYMRLQRNRNALAIMTHASYPVV